MHERLSPNVKGYDPKALIPKYQGNERNASTIDRHIRMAQPNYRRPLEKQLNDGQAVHSLEEFAKQQGVAVEDLYSCAQMLKGEKEQYKTIANDYGEMHQKLLDNEKHPQEMVQRRLINTYDDDVAKHGLRHGPGYSSLKHNRLFLL